MHHNCISEWQLGRGTLPNPVPVVWAGGERIALFCVHAPTGYTFIGTLLPRAQAREAVTVEEMLEAHGVPVEQGRFDDAAAQVLIDQAIERRYGCRIAENHRDDRVPPTASRMPGLERIAVPREALICD